MLIDVLIIFCSPSTLLLLPHHLQHLLLAVSLLHQALIRMPLLLPLQLHPLLAASLLQPQLVLRLQAFARLFSRPLLRLLLSLPILSLLLFNRLFPPLLLRTPMLRIALRIAVIAPSPPILIIVVQLLLTLLSRLRWRRIKK